MISFGCLARTVRIVEFFIHGWCLVNRNPVHNQEPLYYTFFMTEDELAKIEAELNLILPDAYKKLMLNHPGFFKQHELCDYVDPLVYDNRTLRARGFVTMNWPKEYFAFGSDGAGNYYFLTTSPFDGHVYYADHVRKTGPEQLEKSLAFESLEKLVESLRERWGVIRGEALRMNQRIENRRWWEFWVPREPIPLGREE